MIEKLLLFLIGFLLPTKGNGLPLSKQINNEVSSKIVYVDLSLNTRFLEEGSNPYISYNDTNIALELDNNDIYHTISPIQNNAFIVGFEICSFNGEYKTSVITNSLLKEDRYNYLCLSSFIENNNASIEGYGFYSNKTDNPGPTYKTHRVWLNNNFEGFYTNDGWGSKCSNAVMYKYLGNWNTVVSLFVINSKDGSTYHYVDIPVEVKSLYFTKMSSKDNHNYLIYDSYYVDQLLYGVCYYNETSDLSNVTTNVVYSADAQMLGLVVEAYLTYGKDSTNGTTKSTTQSLFNTWFRNKAATTQELKEVKILDYTGYAANGNSYEGLEKTSYFSVNEKWNTMCSQAGINPKTGEVRTIFNVNTTVIIIAVSASVGVVLVFGVLLFLKKRKMAK